MTSATRESTIRAAKKRAAADAQTNITVVTTMMSTVQGRRWVWLQLSAAPVFRPFGTLQPTEMAYLEGQRVAALELLNAVAGHTPTMYVRMMEENAKVKLTPPDEETEQDDEND